VLRAVVQARAATADGRRLGQVLGRWALDRLPDYEVPSDVLVVDRLPTTPNGKVDYRALPPMAVADRGAAAERGDATARAPAGGDPGLTAQLVDVWRELLARPGLGAHDNFFLNGGHSLLALQAVTRVEHLVARPLPVRSVFDHPTPARLAAHLAAGS
jgi:hypothetical protein